MRNNKIVLIEDHHEALDIWEKQNIKKSILIHLDAHIDFGFYNTIPISQAFHQAKSITDLKKQIEKSLLFERYKKNIESQLNIGNYIFPAIRDGIVENFAWIVPGNRENFQKSQIALRRCIKQLQYNDPKKIRKIAVTEKSIKSKLYNKEFLATDILSVKTFTVPVLLDIDVDYLLFDSAKEISLTKNVGKRMPWIYPDKIVNILKKKFPRRLCTTISYSVNGGFTPIYFKFFGDEIALRLEHHRLSESVEKIFALRNAGIKSYFKKDLNISFKLFEQAAEAIGKQKVLSGDFKQKFLGHLNFWLFTISWAEKRFEDARSYYGKALLNDSTLRVADNNFGWLYLQKKKAEQARKEFEKIIVCDNLDSNAHRGLGDVFVQLKKVAEARDEYKKAIQINQNDKNAILGYAKACFLLNDCENASIAVEKLLTIDPLNGEAYELKAELNSKNGDFSKALAFYKEAAILGPDKPEKYRDIFRILKINKNAEFSDFFQKRYLAMKKK